jgi:hypothetical protein
VHCDQAVRLRNKEKELGKVGKSVRRSTARSLASKKDDLSLRLNQNLPVKLHHITKEGTPK